MKPYQRSLADVKREFEEAGTCPPLFASPVDHFGREILELLERAYNGLMEKVEPERTKGGLGGSYYLKDVDGNKVSVFKPADEELLGANHPTGGLRTDIRIHFEEMGMKAGGGAPREVAAFLLDHPQNGRRKGFDDDDKGFCGVPPTIFVNCMHENFHFTDENKIGMERYKVGSFQKYMEQSEPCEKQDSSGNCEILDSEFFPDIAVHKISLLDIRFANFDRHLGNILFRGQKKNDNDGDDISENVLIPIDHGNCFPNNFRHCKFCWMKWPQAHEAYSKEIFDYVESLDAVKDIEHLKDHKLTVNLQCRLLFRISTKLLKEGVKEKLTAFEIGNFMCRPTETDEESDTIAQQESDTITEEESDIEKIVSEAIQKVFGDKLNGTEPNIDNAIEHLKIQVKTDQEREFEELLLPEVFSLIESHIEKYKSMKDKNEGKELDLIFVV